MVGLGRTGVAASRWLADHGVRVYASDADQRPELSDVAEELRAKSVVVDVGLHDLQRIKKCAAVVVSPGVPPTAPPIAAAHAAGVEVVSELDLAARILSDSKLIVVTGTNGKTTTTALIAHLLRAAGKSAEAAGNIGRPLIALAEGATLEWVVVEASSFQLHDSPNLAPAIGVLTNLAPDHLDRYDSVDAYYADKKLLFRNATAASVWVLNGDDEGVQELAKDAPGERRGWSTREPADAWWDRSSDKIVVGHQDVVDRSALRLLGDHNVENVLAALLVVAATEVDVAPLGSAIESFLPLAHRLEVVREVDGVLWINDSKATNVASTRVALEAMDRPFVLLAGGHDKGEGFAALAASLRDCRRVIAYGETAETFRAELGGSVEMEVTDDLASAVRAAARIAGPGERVLLSPACPSFDQFRDFEARGNEFKRLVKEL